MDMWRVPLQILVSHYVLCIEYAVTVQLMTFHNFSKSKYTVILPSTYPSLSLLLQACLSDQASVYQSLQQLQALGDQLKSQVDASSSAAIQSDLLSLTHNLATLEHGLHRQQDILQVWPQNRTRMTHVAWLIDL